jgi:hypothetical protein
MLGHLFGKLHELVATQQSIFVCVEFKRMFNHPLWTGRPTWSTWPTLRTAWWRPEFTFWTTSMFFMPTFFTAWRRATRTAPFAWSACGWASVLGAKFVFSQFPIAVLIKFCQCFCRSFDLFCRNHMIMIGINRFHDRIHGWSSLSRFIASSLFAPSLFTLRGRPTRTRLLKPG